MPEFTASDIERQIFEKEEIRVIIRAPQDERFPKGYEYDRKSAVSTSAKVWIDKRLSPIIDNFEATIIDGNGQIPHGKTKLETIRKSYNK